MRTISTSANQVMTRMMMMRGRKRSQWGALEEEGVLVIDF